MSNKAIIYCRVSSAKQVTEGDGLGSQEHRCHQLALQRGLVVEKVFHERGITGRGDFSARPSMRELLDYLDLHRSEKYHVIFDDLKRFARDTFFHFKLKEQMAKRGAILLCPNFKFENTPESAFAETMYAAFGQLESDQNRRQAMQRMQARLERGYWVFRTVAPGYTYMTDPVHSRLLVPVEPDASIIKEALEGFAKGRFLSQHDLLHYFRNNPIQSKGKTLVVDYKLVYRILTNLLYTGYIEYPKWGVPRTKGHHQALISLRTFEQIQDRLREKPVSNIPKVDTEYKLTQLIKCDTCKMPFTSSTVKGRSKYYSYYACYNPNCTSPIKNYSKDLLEAEYQKELEASKPPEIIIDYSTAILNTRFSFKKLLFVESKTRTEDVLVAKEVEVKSLLESAKQTKAPMVKERYEEDAEKLLREIDRLKATKGGIRKPDEKAAVKMGEELLRTAPKRWANGDRTTRIAIHRMVFLGNPTYSPKTGFRTAAKSLPFTLSERYKTGELSMAEMNAHLSNQLLRVFLEWAPMLKEIL
jgi:site-specific DNA recombinase